MARFAVVGLAAVFWAGGALPMAGAAPKVGPVTALCPKDAAQRGTDSDGLIDLCAGRGEPQCASGRELRLDAKNEADLCFKPGPPAKEDGAPSCAEGFKLRVLAGKDFCAKVTPPLCPKGFTLKVVRGEDQCHY